MPNQLSGQRFFEWRIRFQILAATGTGTAVCIAVTVLMLVNTVERNTEVAGLTTARAVARQVETVRTFYTAEVVGRAKSARMQIDYDFHSQAATLPLPATLVNELGEELSGSAIQLYSAHPFPNHKTRMLDEFQNAPLHAAADNPTVSSTRWKCERDVAPFGWPHRIECGRLVRIATIPTRNLQRRIGKKVTCGEWSKLLSRSMTHRPCWEEKVGN